MVEKIIVSRDEVLHYPWIDHTWVYVHYTKNSTTKNPLFSKLIHMFLKRGILETAGITFESIIMENGYVFIQYDTDEIIDIIKNACAWFLNQDLTPKSPESPTGKFYLENKDSFYSFFTEAKEIFDNETYKYYYQCVDGME